MAECEGPFGGFNEDVVAGATLAFINLAGATSNSDTTATEGFSGAEVAGLPIELVGTGCGNDSADRAIEEVTKLVEEQDANVVIGPLSGDEGVAVANYAKDHPEVTFLDGISGAEEATLKVQAPNFFRFHGEGAQWNAGIGDILHNEAGWDTAAVIADDYGFGWTSAAGFIADFCGAVATSPPACSRRSERPTIPRSSSSCRIRTRSTATSGWLVEPARRRLSRRS